MIRSYSINFKLILPFLTNSKSIKMILAIILSKYLMVLFIMTEKTSVNLPAAHEQIPERAYNRLHPSCEQVPSVQRVFNEQTNASGLEYPVDFIQNQRAVVHRAQCERMHHQVDRLRFDFPHPFRLRYNQLTHLQV